LVYYVRLGRSNITGLCKLLCAPAPELWSKSGDIVAALVHNIELEEWMSSLSRASAEGRMTNLQRQTVMREQMLRMRGLQGLQGRRRFGFVPLSSADSIGTGAEPPAKEVDEIMSLMKDMGLSEEERRKREQAESGAKDTPIASVDPFSIPSDQLREWVCTEFDNALKRNGAEYQNAIQKNVGEQLLQQLRNRNFVNSLNDNTKSITPGTMFLFPDSFIIMPH